MDANEILKAKNIFAVIGVSQDESKYGYEVFRTLIDYNYRVYPVNPKYIEIAGHKCFISISALPKKPEVVIVILSPQNAEKLIESFIPFKM